MLEGGQEANAVADSRIEGEGQGNVMREQEVGGMTRK